MSDVTVVYRALADFKKLQREISKTRNELKKLRAEEEAGNAASAAGAANVATAHDNATASAKAQTRALAALATAHRDAARAAESGATATRRAARANDDNAAAAGRSGKATKDAGSAAKKAEKEIRDSLAGLSLGERIWKLLTLAVKDADKALTKLARAGGGGVGGALSAIGGAANFLNNAVNGLMGPFKSLLKLFIIGGSIAPLIAGLGALGSALLALTGAVMQTVSTMLTLPAVMTTMLLTIITLVVALKGISKVFTAYGQSQKAAAKDAATNAQAQMLAARRIADARRALARARVDEARAAYDAAQRVADAERRLVKQNREVRRAQIDVNKARKEALQDLIDLRREVQRGSLNEEQAVAALAQAQEAYQRVLADPGSSQGDRLAALADLKQAEQDLADVRDTNARNEQSLAQANKAGIDGSEKVQQALQHEADQREQAAEAARDLNEAQRDQAISASDAAQRVADAQRNLAEAQADAKNKQDKSSAAADKYQEELKKLGPKTQEFVLGLIGMKSAWEDLRRSVQDAFFGPLVPTLDTIKNSLAPLEENLVLVAGALGDVAAKFIMWLGDPKMRPFFKTLSTATAKLIRSLGDALIPALDGFVALVRIGLPFVQRFAEWMERGANSFKKWAEEGEKTGRIADKINKSVERSKQLGRILGNIGRAFGALTRAASPFIDWLLNGFEQGTKNFEEFARAQEVDGSPFKKYLEDIKPLLSSMGKFFKEFSKMLGRVMARQENIDMMIKLFDKLSTDTLPMLEDFLNTLSDSGALLGFIDLIGSLTEMFTDLSEAGIGGIIGNMVDFAAAIAEFMKWLTDLPGIGDAIKLFFVGLAAALAAIALLKFSGVLKLAKAIGGIARGEGKLGKISDRLRKIDRTVDDKDKKGKKGAAAGGAGASGSGCGCDDDGKNKKSKRAMCIQCCDEGKSKKGGKGAAGGKGGGGAFIAGGGGDDKKGKKGKAGAPKPPSTAPSPNRPPRSRIGSVGGTGGRLAAGGAAAAGAGAAAAAAAKGAGKAGEAAGKGVIKGMGGKAGRLLKNVGKKAKTGGVIGTAAVIGGSIVGGAIMDGNGGARDVGGSALGGAATGAGLGAMVGSVVPGVGTAIGAGVGGLLGGLYGAFKVLGFDSIKGFFKGVIEKVVEFGKGIGKWFNDHVIKPVKDFLGIHSPSTLMFDIGVDLIKGLINGLWSLVTTVPKKILEGIGDLSKTLFNKGKDLLGGMLKGLGEKAIELGSWLAGRPAWAISKIGSVLSGPRSLVQKGLDLLQGLWNGAKAKLIELGAWLAGRPAWAAGKIGNVLSGAGSLAQKGLDLLQGLWNGAKAKAIDLGEWIAGRPAWVKTKLGELGSTLIQKGKDLWESFKKGMVSAWNGVKTWVVQKMTDIGNFFKTPVKFLIDTVLNKGIIGSLNWIIGKIPGLGEIPEVKLPKGFRRGGAVPGAGDRDTVPAMLTPGEIVIRKPSVRKLGAENLLAMNATGQWPVQKFLGGGLVSDWTNKIKKVGGKALGLAGDVAGTIKSGLGFIKDVGEKVAREGAYQGLKFGFSGVRSLMNTLIGDTMFGIPKGQTNKVMDNVLAWVRDRDPQVQEQYVASQLWGKTAATGGGAMPADGKANELGNRALEWMRRESASPTQSWLNACLKAARMAFGAPGGVPDASTAWENTTMRGSGKPPAGVPVWWTGGHGHVGISDGTGYMWGNDIIRKGFIDRHPISQVSSQWGKPYKGWSRDINGVQVYRMGGMVDGMSRREKELAERMPQPYAMGGYVDGLFSGLSGGYRPPMARVSGLTHAGTTNNYSTRDSGFTVNQLNINNPRPEPASDSLPRSIRKLAYLRGGS